MVVIASKVVYVVTAACERCAREFEVTVSTHDDIAEAMHREHKLSRNPERDENGDLLHEYLCGKCSHELVRSSDMKHKLSFVHWGLWKREKNSYE